MFGLMVAKGLLDNVLSDYLWARAILLVGEHSLPLVLLLEGTLPIAPLFAGAHLRLLPKLKPISLSTNLFLQPTNPSYLSTYLPTNHPRAGPTVATSGLALQVPLAVVLDALLRSPAWLAHAGSTVLTLLGGAVVLAGFFGVNAAGEDDEKTRHQAWEERQQVGGDLMLVVSLLQDRRKAPGCC